MEELQVIQNKIYEIRGTKVMLDFDLAEIYQVETRVLNQAVKRNITRFPTELDIMSSQNVMTLKAKRPKSALPFAFTEHGVIMLASVLRSEIAIQTSILITRAFVAIRKLVSTPPTDKITEIQQEIKELKEYIEEAFTDYNDINEDTRMQLELINQTIAELQSKKAFNDKLRPRIGFVK